MDDESFRFLYVVQYCTLGRGGPRMWNISSTVATFMPRTQEGEEKID